MVIFSSEYVIPRFGPKLGEFFSQVKNFFQESIDNNYRLFGTKNWEINQRRI